MFCAQNPSEQPLVFKYKKEFFHLGLESIVNVQSCKNHLPALKMLKYAIIDIQTVANHLLLFVILKVQNNVLLSARQGEQILQKICL